MIKLPYHTGHIDLDIENKYLTGVLESGADNFVPDGSETEIVERALDNPIGSDKLENLISGVKDMVIITSDHTRPVPSRVTLPIILRRVRGANPGVNVTIVVATGTHRATTKDELALKFGEETVRNERILIHDALDKANMVSLGRLGSGLKAEVNRAVVETDFLMAEGFIEPHFFAGFSGGRKSVFPGVASLPCVMANHCAAYIADVNARTGVLDDNPVHLEALEIAKRAGLKFILNVAIDKNKRVIEAFAGHYDLAHRAGCGFVGKLSTVGKTTADIVITTNGGYPMDQNLYQAVKGMTAAEATCNAGGVIVIAAGCADGVGGDGFHNIFKNAASPGELTERILKRGRAETEPDQWQAQILARVLEKFTVILVSGYAEAAAVGDFFIAPACDMDEALKMARRMKGADATVTVIPDGVSVIVK